MGVQIRESWLRAHFDALRLLGVLPLGDAGCVGSGVASLAALASSALSASLLSELLTVQKHDLFLHQVDEGVKGSDQGAWRDFFRNTEGFLCYQRDGDAVPRICVPKVSRDAILHAAHGGALVGHPGIKRTSANVAQFFWWPNLFRDVAHFVRSCRTRAKDKNSLLLGVDSFSSVPILPFTTLNPKTLNPKPQSPQPSTINPNALPRINIGADVWGESNIMTGVYKCWCSSTLHIGWGLCNHLCLVLVCRGRYCLGGVFLLFILGSSLGGGGPVRGLRGGGRRGLCEEWARRG